MFQRPSLKSYSKRHKGSQKENSEIYSYGTFSENYVKGISCTQQNKILFCMLLPRGNGAGTFFFLVYMQFLLLLILYPIPILCGRINKLHCKSSLSEILTKTYDTSDHRYLLSLFTFYCLGLAIKYKPVS